VDCKTLNGMSGGPAFDSRGFVIGIISTGIGDSPTFVAPIWQALCHAVPGMWRKIFGDDKPRSILELAERGAVTVDGTGAITIQKVGAGALVQYRFWT
jgi:S1-C subfamily serine protease